MRVDFTVHGARKGHVAVDATVNDVKQRVLIDGLEVELVTDTGRGLTLPFHGSQLEEAERLFQPGSRVSFQVDGDSTYAQARINK